jgi:cytoskeletal protein RodZ
VNNLNPAQVEQLKEIGAQLRQQRQEKSISTEEVSAKTYISSRLLTALEEGQSEYLPEPVFIQGFIRRYADVLSLDGDALAKTFSTNLIPTTLEMAAPQEVTQQRTLPSREIGLYALYIVLMAVAAGGLFLLVNRPQTSQPVVQKQTEPVVQQPKTTTKATPAETVAANAPIQASVSLTEESWMEIIVDGKTEFEGNLEKGTKKTWTAKKELKIAAGNAGAVLLSSNQQKEKLLGEPGEVKEITLTSEQ